MKEMKRILSLVLCFVMVLGMLPASVFAAEATSEDGTQTSESVVVIAGSDFQNSSGHEASAATVTAILSQIQEDYPTADGFLFAGDYDYNYTSIEAGKVALQEAVLGVYSDLSTDAMVWVEGNHDSKNYDLVGTTLSSSGMHDQDAYGVYVINESDYMWYNNDEDTIKNTAAALEDYLENKINIDYDKPIFVVSHLPLHYSMRTLKGGGDGKYANYIFDVLNEAGANGLEIIFLFGHNHSHGWDDYLGGAAIYLAKGDSINIAQASTTSYETETLNFTYMNAGYVGYYGDTGSGVDTTLSMTVFEITDGQVEISRYDEEGQHVLKAQGVYGGEYPDNKYASPVYSADTNVYTTSQSVTWSVVPDVTLEDTASGVGITAPGITGLAVSTVTKAVDGYTAYVTYDITPAGYTQGDEAEVTISVDTTLFDASRSVRIVDHELGTETTTMIVDGKVTFKTSHFSQYSVTQTDPTALPTEWVEVAGVTETIFRLTSSLVEGKKYLIVTSSSAGDAYAVNLNDTSINATKVTVIYDAAVNYVAAPATTAQWTYTSSRFQNVSNAQRYLQGQKNKNLQTTGSTSGNYLTWLYDSSNGLYTTKDRNNYYITYSSSNFSSQNNTSGRVYIYQEESLTTKTVYVGVTGKTSYSLMTGAYTTQSAIEELVRNNLSVYLADDSNGTNAAETTDYTISGTVDPTTAGDYTLTVNYGGSSGVDVTISIKVADKQVKSVEVSPAIGEVQRGSSPSTQTGSTMTITYDDGSQEVVPVTVSMLSGSGLSINKNGTYTDLTVTYGSAVWTGYTLNVVNVEGNDFPTYPNGGSVDISKTATGLDFQNTGLAQVQLSTSGLPAGKGADVVIVIDTSSSMKDNDVGTTGKSRIEVLSESLEDMLTQFQTANTTTGLVPDIDIAIIDFNGYYPSSAAAYDKISLPNGSYRANVDYAKVFTGDNAGKYVKNITLSASDFVENTSLSASTIAGYFTDDNCASGTNYDGALENAYKLLAAKKEANQTAGEERDQYVIFLSDGAPFRYNGFNNGSTKSTYAAWNKWLTGYWANETALLSTYNSLSYSYFYNGNGTTHPHRIAEAIKGDVNTYYDVVLREAAGNDPAYIDQYQGLGATIYSIGFGLADDGDVVVATQQELIQVISSGDGYYYPNVQTAEELTDAFTQIVTGISYAAQNAVFVDQMGTAFDLQMNPTVKTNNSANADANGYTTVDTSITVTTYPIYTTANAPTTDDVGKTYGTGTVVEKVSFTVDEQGNIIATSTAVTEDDGNILNDGVICAKNFFYNTTTSDKVITLADGSTYTLPGETFYWNIGTINEMQYTLTYTVYLTGSMDGETVPDDSYETNNYATLYYTNWLGNEVSRSVPSPTMPWGGANVSYAFYLVDSNGNPLLADGSAAANFLTAYKVTQPVLYKTINLNSGATVLSAVAKDVLPDGYTLYDETAQYTVTVNSGDGGGSWSIVSETDVQSTYVVGYAGANDYSNATSVNDTAHDYTHTTVYFAVVWTIGTVPDAVVIDYGLPVDISVLVNDMFGSYGTLAGVGMASSVPTGSYSTSMATGFGTSVTGSYGTAALNGSQVRYTLSNSAGMQMSVPEELAYAVHYTGATNPGYYYGKVTVIPATTIYYEDSFLTLEGNGTTWTQVGTTVSDTQDEDRPGEYSLDTIDANNVYGYDSAYTNMSTWSMGSASKVHVDANSYATASFTFYGTGFDIISMTSNTTGTLAVAVTAAEDIGTDIKAGDTVKTYAVDTYYGYTYTDGKWEVSTSTADNSLYQIPVMKVEGLTYGKYNVVITASYFAVIDHTAADGYDLYLDAIRIYNPTGNQNTTANNAYVADGEGWPSYTELRNNIISAGTFNDGSTKIANGLIFIDGQSGSVSMSDYVSYGPNNELYLANGQAIAFNVSVNEYMADVQLGIKLVNGTSVTYTINGVSYTVSSATDLYYSILAQAKAGTVVIQNVSGGILSLTNIKVTYTQDPASIPSTTSLLWMDEESATYAVMSLRSISVEDETDETEPEETVPEETVPEETEPEETVPEETEPGKPGHGNGNGNNLGNLVDNIRKSLKKLLSWLIP